MKNSITIAYYTIVRNFRDIKSLMLMLLMPVIIILILGNALSNAFEVKNLRKRTVLILREDQGIFSEKFIEVLKVPELKDLLEVKEIDSEEEAQRQVKEEMAAYIKLEEDFSQKIMEGKPAEIVINSLDNAAASVILQNAADAFVNYVNLNQAIISSGLNPGEIVNETFIKTLPVSAKAMIPSAMDYYAVTMLVMISFYGSLYAVNGMAGDYLKNMKSRLRITPVSQLSHFTGKIAGTVVTVFLQVIVLFLFTKFVYNANWGSNYLMIALIALTLSILSVTLGITAVLAIRNAEAAHAVVLSVIPIMTFLAGGYMKFNIDTPLFNVLRKILPSSLGQTAFMNLIYGDSIDRTITSLMVMWLIIGALGVVSVLCGRRRFN